MHYRATCIKGLFWRPDEAEKSKCFFTNIFLIVHYNNSPSVRSGINLALTVAMVTKMAAKVGKLPFCSKYETYDREINIEHKQIPKIYFLQMMIIILAHNFWYLAMLISIS